MLTYEVFDALSDPRRRTILRLLTASDLEVNALAERFEVSRPAVSRHLRVLREAGLVSQRRAGRRRIYRLEPRSLQEAADWLLEVASRRILAREAAEVEGPGSGEGSAEEDGAGEESTEDRNAGPATRARDWKQW